MSVFQQALQNAVNQPAPASGSTISVRGAAGGRRGRGGAVSSARPHGSNPYAKPPGGRNGGRVVSDSAIPPVLNRPPSQLAGRIGGRPQDLRRRPVGTPPILKDNDIRRADVQKAAQSRLNEKLKSEDMKQWLRSRLIAPSVLDMSALSQDAWLKEQGILPPGHKDAPFQAGTVFWRLIDSVLQQSSGEPIRTLSLARNDFHDLVQLDKLPWALPHLRALDLSGNPIRRTVELDHLLAPGEKKGKANAGSGSLNSLIELKLNDCLFREQILAGPTGAENYQHEILRRFPALLILDGVSLNRVVFPIERKPKVRRTDEERLALARTPFTFPVDTQAGFIEADLVRGFVMDFCAKYFPLFDADRAQVIPAYAPTATISISANTLPSRSALMDEVQRTRSSRPNPTTFEAWTNLPGRNFFRTATSIDLRMRTLKSPAKLSELLKWWNSAVPKTRHPLEDASKWCIDAWILDGEGVNTKLCAMIQGQFEELPSGTYRSFSRTLILADAPQGSLAASGGFPATVLSDTMIVHSYLSTGAWDDDRSLAKHGVIITAASTAVPTSAPKENQQQSTLIGQMRQRTGMNEQFATLCLQQNGWSFELALRNFEEIKATIPKEAFA